MIESSLIGFSRGEQGGSSFHAVNPANGESLTVEYVGCSENEVSRACDLAHSAQLVMASLSGSKKAIFLKAVAERIDSSVEELVEMMTQKLVFLKLGFGQKPEGQVDS